MRSTRPAPRGLLPATRTSSSMSRSWNRRHHGRVDPERGGRAHGDLGRQKLPAKSKYPFSANTVSHRGGGGAPSARRATEQYPLRYGARSATRSAAMHRSFEVRSGSGGY